MAARSTARTSGLTSSAFAPSDALELLSTNGYHEYGYQFVEGEVKNISDTSIKNVEAVVSWYTKNDQLVKSEDSLIEFNPILPGQTSPFKVGTTNNPEIASYTVAFKPMFGRTLTVKDSRRK